MMLFALCFPDFFRKLLTPASNDAVLMPSYQVFGSTFLATQLQLFLHADSAVNAQGEANPTNAFPHQVVLLSTVPKASMELPPSYISKLNMQVPMAYISAGIHLCGGCK